MKHPMTLRLAHRHGHRLYQRLSHTLSPEETAALMRLLDHAGCSVTHGKRIPRRTHRTFTVSPKETTPCDGE